MYEDLFVDCFVLSGNCFEVRGCFFGEYVFGVGFVFGGNDVFGVVFIWYGVGGKFDVGCVFGLCGDSK